MKMRIKKPKRPDCNSCYHFSKSDFNETEGYCRVCKKHLSPKEGEECEQFEPYSLYCDTDSMKENEFNLNSAMKYEDGKPMMTDLPVQLVRLLKRIEICEGNIEDLDSRLEEIEKHDERIEICEGNIEDLDSRLEEIEKHEERILKLEKLCNQLHDMITELDKDLSREFREFKKFVLYPCVPAQKFEHIGSNFCGNCAHCDHGKQGDDTVYVCSLSAEIVDPDESSCSMFEHPF